MRIPNISVVDWFSLAMSVRLISDDMFVNATCLVSTFLTRLLTSTTWKKFKNKTRGSFTKTRFSNSSSNLKKGLEEIIRKNEEKQSSF